MLIGDLLASNIDSSVSVRGPGGNAEKNHSREEDNNRISRQESAEFSGISLCRLRVLCFDDRRRWTIMREAGSLGNDLPSRTIGKMAKKKAAF